MKMRKVHLIKNKYHAMIYRFNSLIAIYIVLFINQ